MATADRELGVSRRLDYRAPLNDVRRQARDRAVALLISACKLGDAPSCWRAVELPDHARSSDSHAMAVVLGRQCLAGQPMSCRALRASTLRDALAHDGGADQTDALCAQGLAAACYGASRRVFNDPSERRRWLHKGCELADALSCAEAADVDREAHEPAAGVTELVRRGVARATAECRLRWAASCAYLVKFHRGAPGPLQDAAGEGCKAGMYDDCALIGYPDPALAAAVTGHAMEERCALQGSGCNTLADHRSGLASRDAYEHGCQLGERSDCLVLVKRYRARDLPEPVPGRGDELAAYLCKQRDVPEACAR